MAEDYGMKRAIVAGAAAALKYRAKNVRATDQEVLQHVTQNSDEIISNIEDEE